MLRRTKIAVIIVAIIVILVIVAMPFVRKYDTMLGGMWVGDPEFLKQSKLSDMQLYISPGNTTARSGWLIMTDDKGEFICNTPIEFEYRYPFILSRVWKSMAGVDEMPARISIGVEGGDKAIPFPEKMRMLFSIANGTITLFNKEKMFAFLYKDPLASRAANLALQNS